MSEAIEDSLRNLVSSLQLAKIYPLTHPQFHKSIDKAYENLGFLLTQKEELVLGIIDEELAFEKEVFISVSKAVKPLIQYLKERNVERIVFKRGVSKEELEGFVLFLITPKEKIGSEPQKYLLSVNIRHIQVGSIGGPFEEDQKKPSNYPGRYGTSVETVEKSLEIMLKSGDVDYGNLKSTVTNIMENILSGSVGFLKLATLKKHDMNIFVHLLDVAILSMYFSSKLGFEKEDVLQIGIAALFHDMGKIYVSRGIIEKPDKLSDEEFLLMKSHAVLGAQILLRYTDTIGILPAVVAFEHHLRYDQKGYPKLAFGQTPHIASLIVSLCDVYDALNERRSYKRRYSPDRIYHLMMEERSKAFDPELLDRLFQVIGVWPVGTIVSLSDGRIAVVREINEDDIFSPKVEVISPEDKKEHIDLKEKKEEIKISSFLDPLEEGKKYAQALSI